MKKLCLIFLAVVLLLGLVSCEFFAPENEEETSVSEPQKENNNTPSKPYVEVVYDDAEALFSDTWYIMRGNDNLWDDAETLHEVLNEYTKFAKKYAGNSVGWKTALDFFRYDVHEVFPDVFGTGNDNSQSLKAAIEKADLVSLDTLEIVLKLLEVYDECLDDDDILDRLEYFVEDIISVSEPKGSYDSTTGDLKSISGYYSSIMDKVTSGTDTIFTLKYPDYYKWENTSGNSCSIKNKKSISTSTPKPGIINSSNIVFTCSGSELDTGTTHKFTYTDKKYTVNYTVNGDLPEGATISCDVSTSEYYLAPNIKGQTGKVYFKNPGSYEIKITVKPSKSDTAHSSVSKTCKIKITDPFKDLGDKYEEEIKWILVTPLVTMMEESWTKDFSSKYDFINSYIETLNLESLKETALKALYPTAINTVYNGLESVYGAKNSLKKYQSVDTQYYNFLRSLDHKDEDSVVYSYLELMMPLYLKDTINNINKSLKDLSLLTCNDGLFYKKKILTKNTVTKASSGMNIDQVYQMLSNENSSIRKMIGQDMPYPLISPETIPSTDAEKVFLAELINIIGIKNNPEVLITNSTILDDLDILIDCLQIPMYYGETVYKYNSAKSSFEFNVPPTINQIVDLVQNFKSDLEVEIDAKNYKVREFYNQAIKDIKTAVKMEATTLLPFVL